MCVCVGGCWETSGAKTECFTDSNKQCHDSLCQINGEQNWVNYISAKILWIKNPASFKKKKKERQWEDYHWYQSVSEQRWIRLSQSLWQQTMKRCDHLYKENQFEPKWLERRIPSLRRFSIPDDCCVGLSDTLRCHRISFQAWSHCCPMSSHRNEEVRRQEELDTKHLYRQIPYIWNRHAQNGIHIFFPKIGGERSPKAVEHLSWHWYHFSLEAQWVLG